MSNKQKTSDEILKDFCEARIIGDIEDIALCELGCGELGESVEYDWETCLKNKNFCFHDIKSLLSDKVWEKDEKYLYWDINFEYVDEIEAKKIIKNAECSNDICNIPIKEIWVNTEKSEN